MAQGFAAGAADVVVAANVLHATADLARSLSHIRRLLAPGGLLVLLEITRKPRWLDIVFGVTEGWWKFRDHGLRPDHALLDPAQWKTLLRSEGFAEPAVIADSDHAGPPGQAVMLAQMAETAASGRWLVLSDRGDTGVRLARELERRGGETVMVRPGEAFRQFGPSEYEARFDDAAEIERVLGAIAGEDLRGAVLLSALDAGGETAETLLADQQAVCDSALAILAPLRRSRVPALWLMTSAAQPAGEPATLAVAQAPLWGLARVIMREQPEIRCRLVDIDTSRSDAAQADLAD
jgi:SAM-dependent methyltransferase